MQELSKNATKISASARGAVCKYLHEIDFWRATLAPLLKRIGPSRSHFAAQAGINWQLESIYAWKNSHINSGLPNIAFKRLSCAAGSVKGAMSKMVQLAKYRNSPPLFWGKTPMSPFRFRCYSSVAFWRQGHATIGPSFYALTGAVP